MCKKIKVCSIDLVILLFHFSSCKVTVFFVYTVQKFIFLNISGAKNAIRKQQKK